jgi:4-amino-4-deoxy-L-arabinose transferase
VLAAYLLLYVAPLPFRPLYLPDETRYAEIPREMLATGDWIVPRLNGLRYFEKPVFSYWLTVLSFGLFGQNRFAARLPCALATGLSAALLVLFLRRTGHGTFAFMGAAAFLTNWEVYVLGVFKVPDAVFSAFVTASMVCFYLAFLSDGRQAKRAWLCASGVACGLGFLTKGFLAFAIPAIALCPFLLWQKRWKDLFKLPWIPLLVALAIILPWAIMIHQREPDYWRSFVYVEHIRRFVSTTSRSLHPKPIWFLLPYLIGGALPWTLAAPAALRGLRKVGWRNSLVSYTLCWLLLPFLMLSASEGKLGTYVLPCFAPLTLLLVIGLTQHGKEPDSKLFRAGAWMSATLGGLATVLIVLIPLLNLTGRPIFGPGETWKWVVGSAALFAWCGISIASARASRFRMSFGLFAIAPVALMLCAQFILPKQTTRSRSPEVFIHRYEEAIDLEDRIYSTSYLAPAVCWVLKRSDIGIVQRGGELQYGLSYPDAKNRQLLIPELAKQINDRSRTRGIVLIITDYDYLKYRNYLPEATRTEGADGFVFVKYGGYLDASRKL